MPSATAMAIPAKPSAKPSHCRRRTGSPTASPKSAVTIGIVPMMRATMLTFTPAATA
jgi:hypothetical protein